MILLILRRLLSVSSSSAIALSSSSVSETRFRIYSRLILRSFISATNSACILSIPKPIIRLGMTSLSSSVLRMMAIALSISSSICSRPFSKCSFSFLRLRSKYTLRRTHSMRHAHHSPNISLTPMTLGLPAMSILKLQAKLSISGVSLNSFCMSFSGSVPRLRSMASLRPLRSVSSRISFISFILPAFMSSATLSTMASEVVEYGISYISMIFSLGKCLQRERTLKLPRPVLYIASISARS